MPSPLATIVEGFGEVEAVPILIRRWFESRGVAPPEILRPIRIPKYRLIADGELERAIEQAARRAGPDGKILVLIDADDDCAKQRAPALLDRARQARSDRDIAVILAVREFETWFVAGAESLRGHRDLAEDLEPPNEPEAVSDAKRWLSTHMAGERRYAPTRDQAALAHAMDLDLVEQRSRSFQKFSRTWSVSWRQTWYQAHDTKVRAFRLQWALSLRASAEPEVVADFILRSQRYRKANPRPTMAKQKFASSRVRTRASEPCSAR